MALDLDDIADRYNIADDGSRPGDSKSLADTVAKEDAAVKEAEEKLGSELYKNEAKNQPPTSDNQGSSTTKKETPYYVYGQSPSSNTYPVSFAQNLFGANTDVVSTLKEIKFESFDGSLQNAIAYIVPWKRTGFNSRTPANPTATDTPASQNIPTLADDLGIDLKFDPPPEMGDLYGGTGIGTTGDPLSSPNFLSSDNNLPSFLGDTTPPKWDIDQSKWYDGSTEYKLNTQTYTPATDVKGNKPPTQDQQAAQEKQKALGSEIPIGLQQGILAGTSFLAGSLLQDNPQLSSIVGTGINQVAGSVFNVPTGPIYVGNENGIVNQVISGASSLAALFGVNIPRGLTTTVKPDRQPNTPKDVNLISKKPEDGIWQFLFNPSELGLSLGPKYSESETWGVMDAKESGTPLQFQRMSNPKLKFSGIKLNGYVFGRQVENLEQGLFKLLMTAGGADNGASAGPQVLEFVWGKKTFGPCVIKDISITEKMWDNGLLVNADLNFTLEKIPEWTVNDGQVSVYAPYTQPTQTSPEEQKEETPSEGEKQEPPEQTEVGWDEAKCGEVKKAVDNRDVVINRVIDIRAIMDNKGKEVRIFTPFGPTQQIEQVNRITGYYSSWLDVIVTADSGITYDVAKCGRETINQGQVKLQLDLEAEQKASGEAQYNSAKRTLVNNFTQQIMNCANDVGKALEARYNAQCNKPEK